MRPNFLKATPPAVSRSPDSYICGIFRVGVNSECGGGGSVPRGFGAESLLKTSKWRPGCLSSI